MVDFPYPTFVEIIRACAKVLGIKGADKELDDKALDKAIDPRKIRDLRNALIKKIGSYTSEAIKENCKGHFDCFLRKYVRLIALTPADGVTRAQMSKLLSETLARDAILDLVMTLLEKNTETYPSPILFFSSPGKATPLLLNWLTKNDQKWEIFVSSLSKENKAKVKAWINGEHIPDTLSLFRITSWSRKTAVEELAPKTAQTLLFISAAIDRLSNEPIGKLIIEECRLVLYGTSVRHSLEDSVKSLQDLYWANKTELKPLVGELQHKLLRTTPKKEGDKVKLASMLTELDCHSLKDYHMDYWANWLKARYLVFDGRLEEANQVYKDALGQSLYRAGFQQQNIIEEAIVVASSLASPDKIFLKKLKFASLTFNYDIPSVPSDKASNKVSDVIENWEVDNWRSSFHVIFPESGLFESSKKHIVEKTIGTLGLTPEELEKYQPDFRYPNRRIKVRRGRIKKVWPQLAWFVYLNNVEVVKKLLDKGAKVDSVSSSNESALLIALARLDVTALPEQSLDDRCFRLLAECAHKVETVNTLTSKRRLLPLIEAIKSGRPDIVDTLINMGANVNQRGDTDFQTPLNICIKIIGILKNSEKYIHQQVNMPITPEALDSIRRYNPGMTGFTLAHQQRYVMSGRSNRKIDKIFETLIRHSSYSTIRHASLDNLRAIALTLIDVGADVNASHTSPIIGYTPLMLAVELDEVELVKKMLNHKGELWKSYYSENVQQNVDCWAIAEAFESKQVLRLFEDIKRFCSPQKNYHSADCRR